MTPIGHIPGNVSSRNREGEWDAEVDDDGGRTSPDLESVMPARIVFGRPWVSWSVTYSSTGEGRPLLARERRGKGRRGEGAP